MPTNNFTWTFIILFYPHKNQPCQLTQIMEGQFKNRYCLKLILIEAFGILIGNKYIILLFYINISNIRINF